MSIINKEIIISALECFLMPQVFIQTEICDIPVKVRLTCLGTVFTKNKKNISLQRDLSFISKAEKENDSSEWHLDYLKNLCGPLCRTMFSVVIMMA